MRAQTDRSVIQRARIFPDTPQFRPAWVFQKTSLNDRQRHLLPTLRGQAGVLMMFVPALRWMLKPGNASLPGPV